MVSSGAPGPDAGGQRYDETVFGTPAMPWDQREQLDDQAFGGLRPRHHAGGVHPGWASATQEAYDDVASGGWGVPGQTLTGPIPRLRRPADAPGPTDGQAPAEEG